MVIELASRVQLYQQSHCAGTRVTARCWTHSVFRPGFRACPHGKTSPGVRTAFSRGLCPQPCLIVVFLDSANTVRRHVPVPASVCVPTPVNRSESHHRAVHAGEGAFPGRFLTIGSSDLFGFARVARPTDCHPSSFCAFSLWMSQIADVLRGAVLSPAFAVDTRYAMAISNGSPLFKLPVDAVQRGRDHGLPTYNDARLVSGGWNRGLVLQLQSCRYVETVCRLSAT